MIWHNMLLHIAALSLYTLYIYIYTVGIPTSNSYGVVPSVCVCLCMHLCVYEHHLYVQHVHPSWTITSHCCNLQPTVKLLPVLTQIWGFMLIWLVFSLSYPQPLPIPLYFCSLSVIWFSPYFNLIFFFCFFLSLSSSAYLAWFRPLSLSPSPAHRGPQWCCSLLTRLPPTPQVSPFPHFTLYF